MAAEKICPMLSLREVSLIPCVRDRCMFWISVQNDEGAITGGTCAIAATPVQLNAIKNTIDEITATPVEIIRN